MVPKRLRGQRTPLDQRIKKGHPRIESTSVRGFFCSGPSLIITLQEGFSMKRWLTIFGLALVFCLPGGIQAAEKPDNRRPVPTLSEVVITAARIEQETERIPANVSVITADEIKNSNAKSIPDLLRTEEGIVVRNLLGNGKNAQVDLRGFGETAPFNTLVLVDGRRVNGIDLSGVDWTQIPLDQIERIEIVRGTGSVMYGDNAVGGVVNIITKIPSEKFRSHAEISLGSYDYLKGSATVSCGGNGLSGSLTAGFSDTDGYRDNNYFRTQDIGAKIFYDLSDTFSLNLDGSYHSDDFGLPGHLTAAQLAADRRSSAFPLDNGDSEDSYLRTGFKWAAGESGMVLADVSYRQRESHATFPDPSGTFPQAVHNDSITWGVTPRYSWNGDILNHNNTFIIGADCYWAEQDVDSFGGFFTPLTTKTGISNVTRDSYGIYANNDFSLTENFILSLGARYEEVRYDLKQEDLSAFPLAPLDQEINRSESAYSAGLSYIYSSKSSVFVRANKSFRFPLVDEVVYVDWSTSTIKANTDLEPQTGIHYEAGIRHYISPNISGSITFFRAAIEDELFYNPATFSNENHPETLHQGVEWGAKAELFAGVVMFGNYTYEKATFESNPYKGNDIPAVPNHKANLGVQIPDIVIPGLSFQSNYNYIGASYAISDQANNFEKLKSYYTVDAKLSYRWKALQAYIGVNNLTDRKYSEYAVMDTFLTQRNFYPAPERNWIAGISFIY